MINNHETNRATVYKAQQKHFKEPQDATRTLRKLTRWVDAFKKDIDGKGYFIATIHDGIETNFSPRFNIYIDFNDDFTEYRIKSIVKR